MAEKNIAMPIALKKNNNQFSKAYGKYYFDIIRPKTLDMKGLLGRVAFDQSVYSPDIVHGVIERITRVMVELLQSGQPVDWDGFGKFQTKIEADGIANPLLDFNLTQYIKGVHVRYTPCDKKYQELTSRKLKDQCTFDVKGVLVQNVYGEGAAAQKMYQLQTLDEWRKANPEPAPEPEPEP